MSTRDNTSSNESLPSPGKGGKRGVPIRRDASAYAALEQAREGQG